ncbi:LuxR family transcriptional regulator [Streptomyces sp. NPDC017964]|uniref:LuxR family transcriptional regulator n=1 Tax=Streptomyces sp. NPDC017964 TaxID=3365022 RepID=UPI0037A7E37B
MRRTSLEALARQQLELAAAAGGGHTADTVYGGHEKVLRQTVIGMTEGASLAEHENPGEAMVQVSHGRVRLSAGELSWEGRMGDLWSPTANFAAIPASFARRSGAPGQSLADRT